MYQDKKIIHVVSLKKTPWKSINKNNIFIKNSTMLNNINFQVNCLKRILLKKSTNYNNNISKELLNQKW